MYSNAPVFVTTTYPNEMITAHQPMNFINPIRLLGFIRPIINPKNNATGKAKSAILFHPSMKKNIDTKRHNILSFVCCAKNSKYIMKKPYVNVISCISIALAKPSCASLPISIAITEFILSDIPYTPKLYTTISIFAAASP